MYLVTGIKKIVKTEVLGFKGELFKPKKRECGSYLGPKSTFKTFVNYTWWQALKSGYIWLFWILKENSYYAQNGVNWSSIRIWGPLLLCTCLCCDYFDEVSFLDVSTSFLILKIPKDLISWSHEVHKSFHRFHRPFLRIFW